MRIVFLSSLLLTLLISCQENNAPATPQESVSPKEQLKGKSDELKVQGIVSGVSTVKNTELATAITGAETEASDKIKRNVRSKLKTVIKSLNSETEKKFSKEFSSIQDSILPQLLAKTRVIMERTKKLESGESEVYVLMILDPTTLLQLLDKEIKSVATLNSAWKSSKARKDLQKDISLYQSWKRANTPKKESEPVMDSAESINED